MPRYVTARNGRPPWACLCQRTLTIAAAAESDGGGGG
eukprot:CAMPEP_0118831994 /NCGR_PEP_ID=MMETSP1162-20130426/34475_1 /TAXON_ID=33656 /ORGANISM="Phaeocystis Sp, Strain CCMP2710" /LENGTH=36 /DNA_ID= /DNA_START= /DNA_END= /DNA_ORIENTATION=